tara:strand:- start:1005 stop:1895 length:891 start_codon:yes stop_codon:yes gene_type:complete
MFRYLNNIIENEVQEANLDFYSVIVGTKPSMGARSPELWNKVYRYEEKKVRMVPLDVREEKLEQLFNYLKDDKYCLGGAVAVPYKEKMFNLIKDNVNEEIKAIGTVNCFYRSASGPLTVEFTGTNTDGEAALEPIRQQLTERQNLNICLLGYGGAGKAILAFLGRDFKRKHKVNIFNRSPINIKNSKKSSWNSYSLNDLGSFLPDCDLLINATSVGHLESIDVTVIPKKLLAKAKNKMIVYDIIYDPLKTTLLKNSEELGLRTLNGLRMNLIQAVLAYSYTNQTVLATEEIYEIMS